MVERELARGVCAPEVKRGGEEGAEGVDHVVIRHSGRWQPVLRERARERDGVCTDGCDGSVETAVGRVVRQEDPGERDDWAASALASARFDGLQALCSWPGRTDTRGKM